MSPVRRLREGIRRDQAEHHPHLDPDLESRLPAAVLGKALTRFSFGMDVLDDDAQWWFRGITDALEVPDDRLTLATAGYADDPRYIQAIRVRGCSPRKLQWMLDLEAWTDRALAGGEERIDIGCLRLRRGISGPRSCTTRPDGAPVPEPGEVIDPGRVYYQLLRGDSWFNIHASEDLVWAAASAAAISNGSVPARVVSVDMPEGWIGGPLEGPGSAALADRIERRLAGADSSVREAWAVMLEMLRPEPFARPFASGTRFVAFDLGADPSPTAPAKLEVWEYLAPYGSLDEELSLERDEAGAGSMSASDLLEHPLGPARTLTVRLNDEGVQTLRLWLIRAGPVAYRIQYVALGDKTESKLGEVDRTARSLVATA